MSSSSPATDALVARLAARPWRLLVDPPAPGDWNMAVDVALLRSACAGRPPTLRLYAWDPPAVSLGRFQDPTRGIHWSACARRGWGAVRRPTGGRAVLHQHELTYSITLPPDVLAGASLRPSYDVLRTGVLAALETLRLIPRGAHIPVRPSTRRAEAVVAPPNCGADTPVRGPALRRAAGVPRRSSSPASCFAHVAPCDIAIDGAKLVGSAQARTGGSLLQHGSILLGLDGEAWDDLFGEPPASVAALDASAPSDLPQRLAAALAAYWTAHFQSSRLTPAERALADGLRAEFDLRLELGLPAGDD